MDLSMPSPELPAQPGSLVDGLRYARGARREPLAQLRRLQALGRPLVMTRVLHQRVVDVLDPALAHALLVRHAGSTQRWPRLTAVLARYHGPGSVLAREGEEWSALRQTLAPMFAPRALAGLSGDIVALAHAALHRAAGDGEAGVDVQRLFTRLSLQVIERLLFGSVLWSEPQLDALAADVRLLAGLLVRECWLPGSLLQRLPGATLRARRDALRRLDGALGERPVEPRALAGLDHALRAANLRTLFVAGHDTTAHSLLWWCALMAHHPQELQRTQAEIDAVLGERLPTAADLEALPVLGAGLHEAMRLYPVVPVLPARVLQAPLELGGCTLPRGALLRIAPWALQRDARAWPEPDAFRPQRFAPGAAPPVRGAWMPFGSGPRACLGRPLAMLEMGLVAAVLLQHFTPRPLPGDALPAAEVDVLLRPDRPLRLDLSPRRPDPDRAARA